MKANKIQNPIDPYKYELVSTRILIGLLMDKLEEKGYLTRAEVCDIHDKRREEMDEIKNDQ